MNSSIHFSVLITLHKVYNNNNNVIFHRSCIEAILQRYGMCQGIHFMFILV